MALTSKQRAALRSAANTIDPVFQIGKGEIDETLRSLAANSCCSSRRKRKAPLTPSWQNNGCR